MRNYRVHFERPCKGLQKSRRVLVMVFTVYYKGVTIAPVALGLSVLILP